MENNKNIWIKTGYEVFSNLGKAGLRIESLARKIGISKSSFYHYFANLEIFIEHLLNHHLEQAKIIAEKERKAQNIDPELINILIEHKTDLLFNRQLRIHKHILAYKATLDKANKIIGNDFVLLWAKDLKIKLTPKQLEGLFELALENFYLQINEENLNYNWLARYFLNLKSIAQNFT